MKALILIFAVFIVSCNSQEQHEALQNYGGDTVHIQSVPSVGTDLSNAGYDTSKAKVILPPSKQ